VAGILAAKLQLYGTANLFLPHALMIRIRPSLPHILRPPSALVGQWIQARSATYKHGGQVGRPRGAQSYWSEEKLATNEEYPLSAVMRDTIHPQLEPRGKSRKRPVHGKAALTFGGVHVRAQIVSPDLCGTSRPRVKKLVWNRTDIRWLQTMCSNTTATR
jgi:hypothetical protein